ncbi:MAG: tetraacyldisaccharide 4'-kinase, partial [Flavobacteriaceae bacterium]|nr:tetraacyldisaccharide 4'-kinase [Flavobacteriaceae bacterium]
MSLLRFFLYPFSLLYDLVTRIRNLFYDLGFFKSKTFSIPIIAVGNLSVGGTGKTPQIEYLIKVLQNNYKIAVLSRGYKRKTKGFILIDGTHTSEDVGDEPLQFFKKFPKVCVAVDENRVNGIRELQQKQSIDVVLLDDAYQHRKVKADCYILLTKFDDLYTDDFVLPTGNLRENKGGAKRAHIIIVT